MTPDHPTEPLRRATLPLEALTEPLERPGPGNDLPWSCGRCTGPVEPYSQGHYRDTCEEAPQGRQYHFCCPLPAGCELKAAGAVQGTRP